jgi:uncharacterized protein
MSPTNTQSPYIGAGFAFPIDVNVQGSVQLSNNTPNLEESIIIILGTKLGLYVEEALEMWEPRIIINKILTSPDPTIGLVEIGILYTPKDSYDTRSMVYPFHLQSFGE